MKKIISLVLCFLLVLSLSIPAFAAESPLKVIVANDLHYNQNYTSLDKVRTHNNVSADFAHIGATGKLVYESYALVVAFLEQAAKSDTDVVLIPGDMVDVGTVAEHEVMTSLLAEFEASSGKSVYVVPGNHDFFQTSVEDFIELYADFGYGEAIARDTLSASYTADLNGEYRLLAIDSTDPGNGPHGLNQARVNWIDAQCKQAAADGKKLIAMMHHNLLDHYTPTGFIHIGEAVNSDINLADVLAAGMVKYIFTGHIHVQDILSYTANDGTVIYDVVTGALAAYPCAYREVTFSDSVTIESKSIEAIDWSLVPAGISENALAVAQKSFLEYSYLAAHVGIRLLIPSYITPETLINLSGVNKETDPEVYSVIEKVGKKLTEVMAMPLYKADANGAQSLEDIITGFGKTLPKTHYTDLIDVIEQVYVDYQGGIENYPAYSPEMIIITRSLAAVLVYALDGVSPDEYTAVLTYLFNLLDVNVPGNLISFSGNMISNFENIEIIISTALLPALLNMSVDTPPSDNNVVLPGYAVRGEAELSFWDRIVQFFKSIADFFKSLFAIFS